MGEIHSDVPDSSDSSPALSSPLRCRRPMRCPLRRPLLPWLHRRARAGFRSAAGVLLFSIIHRVLEQTVQTVCSKISNTCNFNSCQTVCSNRPVYSSTTTCPSDPTWCGRTVCSRISDNGHLNSCHTVCSRMKIERFAREPSVETSPVFSSMSSIIIFI